MRLLSCLIFFLLFKVGFGQINPNPIAQKQLEKSKKPIVIDEKAAVLYSNDFSNPSTWSFSNTSIPSVDWQITTIQTIAPINFFQPAGFLTAFNGFAIINSDAQGASAHQDCYLKLNTLITACATKPHVVLRFSQMYRSFFDTTTVEVSNNGSTWTEFLVNDELDNNVNTPNPGRVDLNISSAAGNQDTVYIRFRFRGSNSWFWAIDDVKILEQDEYDLEGVESFFGSTGNWGLSMPYFQIPVEQITPIAISGRAKNAGFGLQPDVILTSTDGGTYTSTSVAEPIGPDQSALMSLSDLWTPSSTLGLKTVTTSVSSSAVDQVPANNALPPIKVNINAKYYARSTDVRTGRVSNNNYQIGFETGNIFDIFADATITSAMVHVNEDAAQGSLLFAKLYEAVDQNTFTLLSVSDTLIMPDLTVDQVFRVRLITPTLLEAGKSYLLTAGSIGSTTPPGLVIGTSGKSDIFTSYFQAENSTDWNSFTESPMVKMNFESVLGLEENTNENLKVNLYPNPSQGEFSLSLNGLENQTLSLKVLSSTGEVVSNTSIHTQQEGQKLDYSFLANGTYFVHITGSDFSIVEKISILK